MSSDTRKPNRKHIVVNNDLKGIQKSSSRRINQSPVNKFSQNLKYLHERGNESFLFVITINQMTDS